MSVSPGPEAGGGSTVRPTPARPRNARAQWNLWLRWLHTYTSMISLLVVLFFALTGITLNHPDWVFGTGETTREVNGTLPAGWIQGETVNWLNVAEDLREQQGLRGRAGDTRLDGTEASLAFAAPGYSADVVIDTRTGRYTARVLQQDALAVLNDLHKGRDAGSAWKWLIDLSGAVLGLVAVTGIGILLFLKKTRRQALGVMGAASVLVLLLAGVALR
ncbi:PepSY-associated TM helix domain-containing protein [Deinococcus navajonensis]|uniref:PepSY-associated TM helix domain-containing protein n=1 Tax=Deinococcus navajonensis TaxID=309884 RepID=A0ABV8XPS5_9DEIO